MSINLQRHRIVSLQQHCFLVIICLYVVMNR